MRQQEKQILHEDELRSGELADFSTLRAMVEEGGWTDVAAMAHICPQGPCMPTCKVGATTAATRRDYFLAKEFLLPAITKCEVIYSDVLPMHSPLQITRR